MAKHFKITISDEIIVARECTVIVLAEDESEAYAMADTMIDNFTYPMTVVSGQKPGADIKMEEEQVDAASSWEIEVDEVEAQP